VEVKIGVLHASRELIFESSDSRDDILAMVRKAIGDGDVIELMDSKGRTIVVPPERLAYVEIGDEEPRRTGFVS
jgi:hypothetical protein